MTTSGRTTPRPVEYKDLPSSRTHTRKAQENTTNMPSLQWFTELTQRERRTLYAGFGGYAVDAFDFMIYSFLIPTLIAT